MKSILFILTSFASLSALLSGILLMGVPDGSILDLPLSLLKTTPFADFRIPGMLLAIIVGGTNTAAVFYNLKRAEKRYEMAFWGGVSLVIWITAQFMILNVSIWLDLFYLAIGISIILISLQLKGKTLY